jgi:hypothetical protein
LTDPRHRSTHAWAAFLPGAGWIIAGLAIVLLLLISFRWVRRKYRVRQAWKLIKREREYNQRAFARVAELLNAGGRQWKANLAVLERLQMSDDAPPEGRSGQITWTFETPEFPESDWQAVLRSGATALLQPEQVHEVEELYRDLKTLRASTAELAAAVEAARQYAESHPSRSGSKRLTEETALAHAVRVAHSHLYAEMQRFHQLHTDFLPVPSG